MSYQNADKLAKTQQQVSEVKDTMHTVIGKAIGRGDQLDELDDKAIRLQASADRFKQQSTQLKWQMCCQSWRNGAILFILVVAVILLIVWACGGFNK